MDVTLDYEEWREIDEDAKDFIKCCLVKDPSKRASIFQLFEHPWVSHLQHSNECDLDVIYNLVQYKELNKLQRIVLSLISGFSTPPDELRKLQDQFMRLDLTYSGTLTSEEVELISKTDLGFIF